MRQTILLVFLSLYYLLELFPAIYAILGGKAQQRRLVWLRVPKKIRSSG
jgi:hypothetical protein